jgi:hypothetical protein
MASGNVADGEDIVRRVRQKVKNTPSRPISKSGKLVASTALLQPPSTNQEIPKNLIK